MTAYTYWLTIMHQHNLYSSCLEKQNRLVAQLATYATREDKYCKIIELGRQLPPYNPVHRIPENVVPGCQSTMYLHACLEGDRVIFTAESEALISAGLAAILINAYSDESPETILKCPPDFLETLGIRATLTPSRANGLHSIYLRMKQDALKLLVGQAKPR